MSEQRSLLWIARCGSDREIVDPISTSSIDGQSRLTVDENASESIGYEIDDLNHQGLPLAVCTCIADRRTVCYKVKIYIHVYVYIYDIIERTH